jgi:hypothetical protein
LTLGRGDERRRCAGRRAEAADRKRVRRLLLANPVDRGHDSARQQLDVEAQRARSRVDALFIAAE